MDFIIPERKLEFLWDYDFKGKSEQQVIQDLKLEGYYHPYVQEAMNYLLLSIKRLASIYLSNLMNYWQSQVIE